MKAFVNELMRDASDATRRQKVIGITHVPIQFSFSSLFLSERDGTRWERVEKAEEWEQHFHYRRQNEEDDKEDDEEEVDAQRRAYLECVEKKEELSIPLTLFRRKTLTYMKYHKEEAKISSSLERTERDLTKTRERERKRKRKRNFCMYISVSKKQFFFISSSLSRARICAHLRAHIISLFFACARARARESHTHCYHR